MAFLIGGANTLATGDLITNSLRFGVVADDSHLEFTPSSGSGATTFTFSCWVKKAKNPESGTLLGGRNDDNALKFLGGGGTNDSKIQFIEYAGGSDDAYYIRTNRRFRDPSAWMHVVLIYDATNGTAGNRMRLYINGTRETSFSNEVQLPQNRVHHGFFHNNVAIRIGREVTTSGGPSSSFNGYIADVYCSDGTAYEPTEFAETNDNGVWVPKEADVSFGTNGFRLEFKETGTSANASGIGADTSGNGNHFSVNALAATDITTDTPQNNFCTGNPLDVSGVDNPGDVCTFSEGNTKIVQAGSNNVVGWKASTIGIRNGKWYFELKLPIIDYQVFGVGDATWDGQDGAADNQFSVYIDNGSETFRRGAGVDAAALNVTSSNNDIWMFALDLDSPKLWIGHQGTWLASGDPAAGSNPMSTQAITDTVFIGGSLYTQNDSQILLNTGNPSYANSSSQADDNGYGDFEYDVPAGFYSICTKNLAEFG